MNTNKAMVYKPIGLARRSLGKESEIIDMVHGLSLATPNPTIQVRRLRSDSQPSNERGDEVVQARLRQHKRYLNRCSIGCKPPKAQNMDEPSMSFSDRFSRAGM